MPVKGKQRYEGKAKKVYQTQDAAAYIVEYKDDATAFNGQKKGVIAGKGVINNRMSNLLFAHLESNGIPTHFLQELSGRETLVKAVEIVPLEVIVRNVAAGSFAKRYGVQEGTELLCPTLEFSLKDDALGDPLLNQTHILALGIASPQQMETIISMAHAINRILTEYFSAIGIRLVDFKLEFGKLPDGSIVLADEISPDTCRLWDMQTQDKLDKDRFRRDLGGVEEAYRTIYRRLGLAKEEGK
ncbi:phosphoribosylaminoimidazolesuccinocarboxamide synthase [Eubacteriales bacterium OttesenSCG-928-N14]|nr:phosphoribosylaminoimidazolesuccinocarboxamide synthase [Eubacteriales bacterium OttesenSCG-928-N14]